MSEGGGDARMLTTPDTAERELGHWWPQILPDGDHVLFTAYRTPIERATIEVLSISTGKRKVLLTGGVFGYYVPTGHLLYAVGETIRAVPFDLNRLAVTGAGLPVVDSVAMNLSDGAAAFDVSENGNARVPAEELLRHRDPGGAGGPTGPRVSRASCERPLQPSAPLARRQPDRRGHPLGQLRGRRLGVPGGPLERGTRLTSEGGRDWGAEWTPMAGS